MPKAVENSQPPSSPGFTGAAASCSATSNESLVRQNRAELGEATRCNGDGGLAQTQDVGARVGGTSQSTSRSTDRPLHAGEPRGDRRAGQQRQSWSSIAEQLLLQQTNRPLEAIAKRLDRSPSSILARLRRLGHSADFFGGFKTKDLVQHLQVPPSTIRRWQRRGWLRRRKGRITEGSLRELCQNHPEEIPFLLLPPEKRFWLEMVMGYPNPVRSMGAVV